MSDPDCGYLLSRDEGAGPGDKHSERIKNKLPASESLPGFGNH